jgi:hypothetical protein
MRKKYKPKPIKLNALDWVVSGLRPISSAKNEILVLRIKNHGALDSLLSGNGGIKDADTLIATMNIVEALASMKVGGDWVDEIRAAQDALFAMSTRGVHTGLFKFTALELASMNTAMDLHDAQLDAITIGQMEQAINITKRILSSGKVRVIQWQTAT